MALDDELAKGINLLIKQELMQVSLTPTLVQRRGLMLTNLAHFTVLLQQELFCCC